MLVAPLIARFVIGLLVTMRALSPSCGDEGSVTVRFSSVPAGVKLIVESVVPPCITTVAPVVGDVFDTFGAARSAAAAAAALMLVLTIVISAPVRRIGSRQRQQSAPQP